MAGIREFFQRFARRTEPPSVGVVANRFLQLFHDHGLVPAQIPRLFPRLRLEDLKSEETLLAALDNSLLEEVAKFFGVRIEWLEGVDDTIYEAHPSYKCPGNLFEDLAALPPQNLHYPIRVLANDKNLDRLRDTPQYLVLVMAEKIGELGELTIERFRIYDNLWDWHHPPCRLQLKAVARLLHQALHIPIPIYEIDLDTLETISKRRQIPRQFIYTGFCPSPCLEDFGLSKKESHAAKDTGELSGVYEFIREYSLKEKANLLKRQESVPESPPAEPRPVMSKQEKARKAANTKNASGNQLKQQFIEQFSARIEAKEISRAKAAAEFYDKLNEQQAILLCRSAKDYQKSTPDEVRSRAIRTLRDAYRDSKKPKPD
jgi:hypothetical protein